MKTKHEKIVEVLKSFRYNGFPLQAWQSIDTRTDVNQSLEWQTQLATAIEQLEPEWEVNNAQLENVVNGCCHGIKNGFYTPDNASIDILSAIKKLTPQQPRERR